MIERPLDARTERSLRDIVQFCRIAADLVQRGRASYDSDRIPQLAAEAVISRIGEAVARLDPSFVEAHPDVPFRTAKGMRNLLSHEYHRVDPAIVWGVLENRLPGLCVQVEKIIADASFSRP